MTAAGTAREFRDRFTIFPDRGVVQLNCFRCPGPDVDTWEVGYHPSLDVLIEQARAHDLAEHADEATARAEAAEAKLAEARAVLLEGGQPAATARRRALAVLGAESAPDPT